MADPTRQVKTTTAAEMLGRSSGSSKSKDALGGALSALSGSIGNDELMGRISSGNGSRDDLLDFLVERLANLRTAQLAELQLANARTNTVQTALGASEALGDRPNPKRWIQAAQLYQAAANALCAGQLHRGAALVDQAVVEDRRAFAAMSSFVRTEARAAEDQQVQLSSEVACTPCAEPEGVGVADEIQRVTTEGNPNIKGERRELDPWWTDLEEEEEEEAGGA